MLTFWFVLPMLTIPLLLFALIFRWYYIFFNYKKHLKAYPTVKQVHLLGVARQLQNAVDKPRMYNVFENATPNSLLVVNGNEWRRQRKTLNPSFNCANMKQNIHIFNTQSDDLVKTLSVQVNKETTELDVFVMTWASNQVCESMLGVPLSLKDKLACLEAVECVTEIAVQRNVRLNEYYNVTYVFTRNYWLERKTLKVIFDHVRDVIRRKKAEKESGVVRRDKPTLIDTLLKQMETDDNVTETFILKQVNLMVGASFDTSATTISFALYNLSIYPDIQEKAYDELLSLLGDDINQPIMLQHVKDMKYLDLVIKELMRIKTTVPFFLRELNEDVKYKGITLPNGLTIMVIAFVMHRDSELYPDHDKFIPERLLPENLNPNRYNYAPFARGVRNCIGQKYATISMKVVLAKILLNYKLVDAHHVDAFGMRDRLTIEERGQSWPPKENVASRTSRLIPASLPTKGHYLVKINSHQP